MKSRQLAEEDPLLSELKEATSQIQAQEQSHNPIGVRRTVLVLVSVVLSVFLLRWSTGTNANLALAAEIGIDSQTQTLVGVEPQVHTLRLMPTILAHQIQKKTKTRREELSSVKAATISVQTIDSARRGVLFDVDGTLSDSSRLGFEATKEVLLQNGMNEISEDDYHLGTKYTTPARFAWHVSGNPDDPIGEKLGQQFDDLYVNLVSTDTAKFYAGVKEMLLNLERKYPQIIYGALSNACGAYVEAVLDVNEVSSSFKIALGADEVDLPKPNPDGLLYIATTLNLEPSLSVYVGDSPTDGMAAKAAGMRSIGVTWGSHPPEAVRKAFDVTVDSVEELQKEIAKFLE